MSIINTIKKLFKKPHSCSDHWVPGYDDENKFKDDSGYRYMGVRYCAKCGRQQRLIYYTIGNIRYKWEDRD